MQIIKFSHRYKKMPRALSRTYIKDVALVHYDELTPKEIELDTETVDGQFYELPHTKLIWIKLWSDGHEWSTLRRYTPEKFEHYTSLLGQQVRIVIEGAR